MFWKLTAKQILIAAGIVILILLMTDFNNRLSELHRLSEEKERVGGKATAFVWTQESLETQIAYATSEAAVERWAYEEGRMARSGDQVVVPLPAGGISPTPTPLPQATATPVSNWEIWRALFFERE